MKAPKSINIAQDEQTPFVNRLRTGGPKKLINLLQNNDVLVLKGKNKIFKIQKDFIQIFQNQVLTLDQIPTHLPIDTQGVADIELNNVQKSALIKNDNISVGKLKISLDKKLLQLNIKRPIQQHEQTQFVNRPWVGGHKVR